MSIPNNRYIFFWNIIAVILCTSCRKDTDIKYPYAELHLTVKKENGDLANQVKVSIFDDYSKYHNATSKYTSSGAVDTGSTINGRVSFRNLLPGKKYWILAHSRDFTTIPGTPIDYDNSLGEYSLSNTLRQGSISHATVILSPSSLLTFWTNSANGSRLPIKISLSSDSIGILTNTLSSQPSTFQTGAVTFTVRKGRVTYYAKSENGCVWTNELNIEGGKSYFIELETCTSGQISFWTQSENASVLPITVMLGTSDTIGVITQASVNVPINCHEGLTVTRQQGTYNYFARSSSGACLWSGQINLSSNSCNIIRLDKCE